MNKRLFSFMYEGILDRQEFERFLKEKGVDLKEGNIEDSRSKNEIYEKVGEEVLRFYDELKRYVVRWNEEGEREYKSGRYEKYWNRVMGRNLLFYGGYCWDVDERDEDVRGEE